MNGAIGFWLPMEELPPESTIDGGTCMLLNWLVLMAAAWAFGIELLPMLVPLRDRERSKKEKCIWLWFQGKSQHKIIDAWFGLIELRRFLIFSKSSA